MARDKEAEATATVKPVASMNDLPPSSPPSSSDQDDDDDEANDQGGQFSQGTRHPCLQPKSRARPVHEFGFIARGRNQELAHGCTPYVNFFAKSLLH